MMALDLPPATTQPAAERADPAPAEVPPAVATMLEDAAAQGNRARLEQLAAAARASFPRSAEAIDALVARLAATLPPPPRPRIWRGSGEAGGSIATGNTEAFTAAAAMTLERRGTVARHRLGARVDLQGRGGRLDQERLSGSWQGDHRIAPEAYVWGRFDGERNRPSGLEHRFAASAGLGWRLFDDETRRLELEGGPALRTVRFSDREETVLAARLSMTAQRRLGEGTRFDQTASLVAEAENMSLASLSQLTARLVGRLSARGSLSVLHESDPPPGRLRTDTISRLTLVLDF